MAGSSLTRRPILAVSAGAALAAPAVAQQGRCPSRPVRSPAPWPSGGPRDTTRRAA